ncbi:MAG TPA: formate dehydrogenase subunit delta [Gammaproteobacteria bacterium]
MDIGKLVRMANQIAKNLDYGQDREKVVAATADHLKRFWTPEMRRQIVAYHLEGGDPAGEVDPLSELAANAVARIAEEQRKDVA